MVIVAVILCISLLITWVLLTKHSKAKSRTGVDKMPQGLQCFDDTGNIVVDLTDRQLMFVKQVSLESADFNNGNKVPGTTVVWEFTTSGIDPINTVAYVANEQFGTADEAIRVRHGGTAVAVVAQNTYRVASFGLDSTPHIINFYRFI